MFDNYQNSKRKIIYSKKKIKDKRLKLNDNTLNKIKLN
jgi:hypothetical protein